MKITALVENISNGDLKAKHGLSLYIETQKHKILFDLGPDNTLFDNAQKRNIDLSAIDTVIISHGHSDHGGVLSRFLEINNNAKIYVQQSAFEPHYSKIIFFKINVGIDNKLKNHPQVILLNGDYQIDDELSLFTVNKTDKCHSPMNDVLYEKDYKDTFLHEQNLIINEKCPALIMGCGHVGIVNILEQVKTNGIKLCVGGFHLFNPITKRTVSNSLLDKIITELQTYKNIQFYTCHCTGSKAFTYLSKHLANLAYLHCGETIEL